MGNRYKLEFKRFLNLENSVQNINTSLGENVNLIKYQMYTKMAEDSILSIFTSKAKYEDTNSTIFTENWTNLTNWVTNSTPGVQVSGNKVYSTGTGASASAAVHGYALAANENLRAVFTVVIPTVATTGGIIIGVSNGTAGATPVLGAGDAFGLYFRAGNGTLARMELGVITETVEGIATSVGTYIVTVTVDQTYISVHAIKNDGSVESTARRLRAGFNVNNLYVFNSDARGLGGIYIDKCSARKSLQTITPRTFSEGIVKTVQWTGDGTQSFRIYLPANYDSRIPSPLAICFHGNGTNETAWTTNGNMSAMQKALVNAGFIVLGCSLDSLTTTWGNSASTNAYYQAYKYVRDNYAIGSVVFYSNSMGGIESLNALSENKIPCVAWAGSAPTFNLKNNYDNSMFTGIIKTAYGIASDGSDYTAKTTGRDPNLMSASAFRGLPMWMAAASDDTAVSKSENMDKLVTLVQGISSELVAVTVPNGQGGHSFSISTYSAQIVTFLKKYVNSQ